MENRMEELVRILNEHAYYYYVMDDPRIADAEYDRLFDELLKKALLSLLRRNEEHDGKSSHAELKFLQLCFQ